ncbi:hypothetical protein HETIRDRAFT_447223 [Heterobasidion irregulare TC 32-1]|uniref:Uncharacterized protein n=1 Tax=Heterobasidion irregulare (strain TC 32-1) TaxID=747525 RepID=W4KL87_HETIT|nr:uncharacterized protein HETIRDRAFT_447223 [Heterobasidion irregulare TC 32-1]ETW86469.1 hypothetical protein HETIRDRAFT_447223 [Heterobasidion irregulare TC 32-1]
MLLHEDHEASSPSRNSSPDVVLMVSNPDIGRVDRGTSPHPSNAGRVDRGTSPHRPEPAVVTLTPHLNNFSDDNAEDYAKGPHEMHHGMKTLMTETYRALTKYQWEFHLLLQSRRALELQVPRDYEQEQQLNSQAMEKLSRYQLYRELHLRQYQLVDRFPTPWEELPLRSTISAGNPGMSIATYLNDWLVPVSRSEDSPSKQTLTPPLGMNITTDDHEPSSSIPTNSPSMSTESSFQLSSSPENWAPSNQVEPTLSALSSGMYHVPENVPRLYQIQEGLRTRSWNALHRGHGKVAQHIAIPRHPPLTGYEIFPYPMGVPTRRNHPSIEETREEGVEGPRQPSATE